MSIYASAPQRAPKITILAFVCLLLAACASHAPLKGTTAYVDAKRFAGEWHVIANIPYFAERNKVASKTIYLPKGPGLFDDIYESRDGSFEVEPKRLVGKLETLNEQNTLMQSTFYWVIKSKFEVLYIDDGYELMLLGHKSRKYAWIMARGQTITEKQHASALELFADNGFDTSQILKVPQLPEQLGQPGFQTIK